MKCLMAMLNSADDSRCLADMSDLKAQRKECISSCVLITYNLPCGVVSAS